jgi:hypothetical protein
MQIEIEPDEYELSDDHFNYFVLCCKGWLDHFGIKDWQVDYALKEDADDDFRAMTIIYCESNRVSEIILANIWDVDPNDYQLSKTAFHEVLELLLADLSMMAANREFNHDVFDRERHRVIRMLERAVFNRSWNNGHNAVNIQSESEVGCSKGRKVSEIHSEVSMPDTWVQRLKSKSRRWLDCLSPF